MLKSVVQSFCIFSLIISFTGCANIQSSTPISKEASTGTVSLVSALPQSVPKGSLHYEDYPFLFVNADHASEFAAGLLVPVPFVTDAVIDSAKKRNTKKLSGVYTSVDVYELVENQLAASPRFKESDGEFSVYPMVVVEECIDDKYRLSLMLQVEKGKEKEKWMGRYHYHLPTAIPKEDIKSPTDEELATFEEELNHGTQVLISILDKSLSGDYPKPSQKVTIASLYIVGGKLGGLTSPNLFRIKNTEVIEESENSLILRVPGDLKAPAKSGGLAYGVHHFYKDQLSFFESN